MGDAAFGGCSSLKSVTLPQIVCNNGFAATFPDSSASVTNIVISEGVTNICDSAFRDCTGLVKLVVPDSVKSIGSYAFQGCTNLVDVTIPPDVNIGYRAFELAILNVTAKQRFPWNGLVDIKCRVLGIEDTTKYEFNMTAILPDSGNTNKLSHFWVVQGGTNVSDFVVRTNGNYWLVWDAQKELGQVRYTNIVVSVDLDKWYGKTQLWEGGPYWAEMNIGAENPEDYGYYFYWGDTVGYMRENDAWVASDGSSLDFSFNEYATPTYGKSIATLKSEGWITTDNVLVLEHDAAYMQWGEAWRMPTKQELSDLVGKCDWTMTTINGMSGYLVRGKDDYASFSIFLPSCGSGEGRRLYNAGSEGWYWSAVSGSDYSRGAHGFRFYSGDRSGYDYRRNLALSIRPVRRFSK